MSKAPKDEPQLALDQIQGNVIPGFLKNHQHFHFFSITDAAAARTCLGKLHSSLSTAAQVLEAHRVWKAKRAKLGHEPEPERVAFRNLALSAAGLRKLTSNAEVDQFADVAFKLGLLERSSFIGDPGEKAEPGHASGWVVGSPANPVDGVLIMASDHLAWLLEEAKKLTAEFSSKGMKILHEDRGDVNAAPQAGHEQFGFKDGISHPSIRGRWPTAPYDFVSPRTLPMDKSFDTVRADFAEPGRRLIWPGHFLFGYGRQKGDDTRTYDSADRPKGPGWAKDGSLMVYRRLRQNPDEFSRFVEATAKALAAKYPGSAPDKDRLAALLVGRWPTGTPVARSPDKDIGLSGDALNYFLYADKATPALPGDKAPNPADPEGHFCPLGAHIRKVNPRDQATDLGFAERTPPRSLLRRGITYAAKSGDKGLIFVAYQSSIVDQFEFLMRNWINKPNTPRDHAGHDPILAQGAGRYFYLPIGKEPEKIPVTGAFVVPTGGEYFFSPSMNFFKTTLTASAKK
jgi:Dyp-type peroxidase family